MMWLIFAVCPRYGHNTKSRRHSDLRLLSYNSFTCKASPVLFLKVCVCVSSLPQVTVVIIGWGIGNDNTAKVYNEKHDTTLVVAMAGNFPSYREIVTKMQMFCGRKG